jgi:hypothetical protein
VHQSLDGDRLAVPGQAMENDSTLKVSAQSIRSKLYIVVAYFPWHCKRLVVIFAVEKALDIVDKLKLHLRVENHVFPPAGLHILPKPVVLLPIASIVDPYLLVNLRLMLGRGHDELVRYSRPAVYNIARNPRIEDIVVLHSGILTLPVVDDIYQEIPTFPVVTIPPELDLVLQASFTPPTISVQLVGP